MIKTLVLVDGTQIIGEVEAIDLTSYNIRKPHRVVIIPAESDYQIALQPYPIMASENISIHRNSVITCADAQKALEEYYTRTTSPIDLVTKLSTGDRKAR